jgi:hypothetical protein
MRILGSIVVPSTSLVALREPQIAGCSPTGSEVICDQLVWDKAVLLQKLPHQFERRPLVASGLDQNVEDFTLGVDGTPQVD